MIRTHRRQTTPSHSPRGAILCALLCAFTIGALSACGDDEGTASSTSAPNNTPNNTPNNAPNNAPNNTVEAGLTFWGDVAPVLDASCMGCHQEGGVAPFTLETYEDVRTWGPAIVAATQSRAMPPWLVTGDGSCGEFQHNEWLSDDALDTLKTWVDEGMAEGTPGTRNFASPFSIEGTHTLTTPDFSPVREGSDFAEFDEYRCFLVPIEELTETRYLTGFEVHPGNEAIVHHVIGSIVDPDAPSRRDGKTNGERMAELDAESPDRDGWPCYSQAGPGVNIESDPLTWAPGMGAVNFPEGTGIPVQPGQVVVLQMHYNLSDEAQLGASDQSEVVLQLDEQVDTVLFPFYVDYLLGLGEQIPAGEEAYEYKRGFKLGDLGANFNIKVWGLMPHMHERGVKLRASIRSEGDLNFGPGRCMAEVNQWDFDWQRIYWYKEPVVLTPQDTWEISCTFNTSNDTEPTLAGWGTQNEMCLTVVYLSL